MANPFEVTPPNPLQALMLGVQGYDRSSKAFQEQEMKAGRLEAVQALQTGGDPRGALAKLIGIGDVQGARAIADYAQQQVQNANADRSFGLQEKQFAESSRHNRASEAITSANNNKPVVVPAGSSLVDRAGKVIHESALDTNLDDATLGFMADQYMAGDTSVLTNLGRGAQGAQNVVALRKEIARRNAERGQAGADQAGRNAEFFGTKAGHRTLGTRSANIELAATEFQQVLPVVERASAAVNRTQYPDLNKIIQAYNEKTGDPNIVAFGGAVNTLVNLYARAISPTGQPTVSDKDHAREILQKSWSAGQFNAAVGMMKQEIDAALASPEKVREEMRRRFLSGQPGSQPGAAKHPAPAGGAAAPQQPAAIPEGATATNPQTGQKIVRRNGQWVPAQ